MSIELRFSALAGVVVLGLSFHLHDEPLSATVLLLIPKCAGEPHPHAYYCYLHDLQLAEAVAVGHQSQYVPVGALKPVQGHFKDHSVSGLRIALPPPCSPRL